MTKDSQELHDTIDDIKQETHRAVIRKLAKHVVINEQEIERYQNEVDHLKKTNEDIHEMVAESKVNGKLLIKKDVEQKFCIPF